MSTLQKIAAGLLALLLALAGYGWWRTATSQAPTRKVATPSIPGALAGALPVIDESLLLTARHLSRLSHTAEEQPLAQAAVETAEHELDLAFTVALRHLEAHPPPLNPEVEQIQQRLVDHEKALASNTDAVKHLQAALVQAAEADKPALQDRLDLAQSQVELEQDEIAEANADLMQAGGSLHQRIQMMQQEHEAIQRAAGTAVPAPTGALVNLRGLVGQLREWLALRDKAQALAAAERDATASATQLSAERAQIASDLAASKAQLAELTGHTPHAAAPTAKAASPPASAPAAPATALSLLDLTRQVAAEQHRLTLRDERISARHRLARIYQRWQAVVDPQAELHLHRIAGGAAVVLAALLLLLFADRWLERLLGRAHIDRRQLATLRSVIGVSLQVVGVVIILIVLVGVPAQLGTMIGIAGAGLTVALKDFIVAFLGWFVLMGRNGMRIGDWVEINGVSGEVVELNMFHTVLLETGNWTDAGHPTGRRVTFTNGFAIAGHYFNFSTSGQWLWDELSIVVPFDHNPQAVADAIEKEVTAATAKYASQAEAEWRRTARGERTVDFSARPGVAMRPATGGVEIAVRYVTTATERLALRAQLHQSAVRLLSAPV